MEVGSSRSSVGKLETQESWWFISSPKTVRLKTQKELIFQVKSKGKKRIGGWGQILCYFEENQPFV